MVVRRTHNNLLHLLLWTSLPLQGLPPCRGGVQVLLLLLLPPPQVLEHWPHTPQLESTPSTGKFTGGDQYKNHRKRERLSSPWQALSEHLATSLVSPLHSLPPPCGGVQLRTLTLPPSPQVAVHTPHLPHCPTTPSTATAKAGYTEI